MTPAAGPAKPPAAARKASAKPAKPRASVTPKPKARPAQRVSLPTAKAAVAKPTARPTAVQAPPRQWVNVPAGRAMPPVVHYVQRPRLWMRAEEPIADRLSRTDVRLALAFLVAGTVVVFLNQMPFIAQVVVGAPLFEEMFKLGLALLPCAALKTRLLALRLPLALGVGAGFGALEHFLSYAEEETFVLYGRMAFHGLSTGLSMLVLHRLSDGNRRLTLGCTFPSTVIHAANNTAALELGLASIFTDLDAGGPVGLQVAAAFLAVLAIAFVSCPFWLSSYRSLLERYALPRLGPPQPVRRPSR